MKETVVCMAMYHIYKDVRDAVIGKELENRRDVHAVAVKKVGSSAM